MPSLNQPQYTMKNIIWIKSDGKSYQIESKNVINSKSDGLH